MNTIELYKAVCLWDINHGYVGWRYCLSNLLHSFYPLIQSSNLLNAKLILSIPHKNVKKGGDGIKEILIKSNYFKLAKTADIFHEVRRNRATITSHFVKNSDSFFCA